jgi:hypothetical protein
MNWIKKIGDTEISKEQTREFGMLTVLVTSFIAFYWKQYHLLPVIFILSGLTLLFPVIFYPFAVGWFMLSKIMGKISTAILLGVVFIIIVIPVGLLRKIMKLDGLKIKQFKKGSDSVMTVREHSYTDSDLLHTF